MNKKILILQFRPAPTDAHEVSCILKAMEIDKEDVEVINVTNGDNLPTITQLSRYSGFIFGASSDYNVTDWSQEIKDRAENTRYIYQYARTHSIPTLGICFGHQLLAQFMGATVERDSTQAEGGIVDLSVVEDSPLFAGCPPHIAVATGHKDSITSLPSDIKVLGKTDATTYSVIQAGKNMFSIQQHPELDVDALVWRFSLFPEYTRGRSLEEMRKDFRPMPFASHILKNFKNIIDQAIIV